LSKTPFVVVSVIKLTGSSPEITGTRLVVTKKHHSGPVPATDRNRLLISEARRFLARKTSWYLSEYQLNNIAGAENGSYSAFFQYFDALDYPAWLVKARDCLVYDRVSVLVSLYDLTQADKKPAIKIYEATTPSSGDAVLDQLITQTLKVPNSGDSSLHKLKNHRQSLLQKIQQSERSIVVIGQSPVATALVSQLLLLPLRILWLGNFKFDYGQPGRLQKSNLTNANIQRIASGSSVAIATGNHELDIQCCFTALRHTSPGYLGCLGSTRKAILARKQLQEKGLSTAELQNLHMPIGISSISDKHPSIIAASIVAQILGTA